MKSNFSKSKRWAPKTRRKRKIKQMNQDHYSTPLKTERLNIDKIKKVQNKVSLNDENDLKIKITLHDSCELVEVYFDDQSEKLRLGNLIRELKSKEKIVVLRNDYFVDSNEYSKVKTELGEIGYVLLKLLE